MYLSFMTVSHPGIPNVFSASVPPRSASRITPSVPTVTDTVAEFSDLLPHVSQAATVYERVSPAGTVSVCSVSCVAAIFPPFPS